MDQAKLNVPEKRFARLAHTAGTRKKIIDKTEGPNYPILMEGKQKPENGRYQNCFIWELNR